MRRVWKPSAVLTILATITVALATASAISKANDFRGTEFTPHRVRWLHRGPEALQLRLEMIARAKHSIELESYIFSRDKVGTAILQALVKKKKDNPQVQIRLLTDYFKSSQIRSDEEMPGQNDASVQALLRHKIEVRRFNQVSRVLHPVTFNRRDHRKLLIIDHKEFITGGRNLADEYFDIAPEVKGSQWMDRDIWVEGAVTKDVVKSFNEFFNATPEIPMSTNGLSSQLLNEIDSTERELAEQNQSQRVFVTSVEDVGGGQLKQVRIHEDVRNIWYKYDRYSKDVANYGVVAQALDESFLWANQGIFVETYLFLPSKERRASYVEALARHVKVRVLTNSEVSIPSQFLIQRSQLAQDSLIPNGLESFEIDNRMAPQTTVIGPMKDRKDNPYSIHSKTYLFISEIKNSFTRKFETRFRIGCGSFNEDGRSSYFNFESMLFIEGEDALAAELLANIELRGTHSLARHTGESRAFDAYKDEPWYKRIPKRLWRWQWGQDPKMKAIEPLL